MHKKTKIIATIGPASDSIPMIKKLYKSGMNVARLNFSHGTYEYFAQTIKNIRAVSDEITIMLDTKGPEIRTSKVETPVELKLNQKITLSNNIKQFSTKECIQLHYNHLFDVSKGNTILIDDGAIAIEIQKVSKAKKQLEGKVISASTLSSNKTVSIHGHNVRLPFLSKKDKEDILFGIKHKVDVVAASFVRKHSEVQQLKKFLEQNKGEGIKIISKIEHGHALEEIDGIIEESFGIMVARGDLGVEIPIEKVPFIQERLIAMCNELGKPVIVATQMLESMKEHKTPTRAEVNDVAQAILQGADCVMLSAETANGKFPKESVEMMNTIALEYDPEVESYIADNLRGDDERIKKATSLFVTKSAYYAAKELNAQAIIVPTETGYSARKVSRFKPEQPIYAVCRDMRVFRQLQMSWGVVPSYHKSKYKDHYAMTSSIAKALFKKKLLNSEKKVVVVSGRITNRTGHTNTLEVFLVKNLVYKK